MEVGIVGILVEVVGMLTGGTPLSGVDPDEHPRQTHPVPDTVAPKAFALNVQETVIS